MACTICGAIAMGGKCQRCKTATRLARVVRNQHEKKTKIKPQPIVEARVEVEKPADANQRRVSESERVAGTANVANSSVETLPAAETPQHVDLQPRRAHPTWHREPEVEVDPFDREELPRHYLVREGKPKKR